MLGADPRQIQRELLSKMIAKQDIAEVPREIGLGPEFFKKDKEQCLDILMNK
jgi:hypothetical protein